MRSSLFVALLASVYLLRLTLLHSGPAGCGPLGGCSELLNSRWSHWFGVPVSALAAGLYGLLLLSSARIGRTQSVILLAGTGTAAVAAIWFAVLQLAVVGRVCPYCMLVHGCGLLAAIIVWTGGNPKSVANGIIASPALGLLILVGGQLLLSRPEYRVHAGMAASVPAAPLRDDAHLKLVVGGQLFDLDSGKLPVIGSRNSKRLVIVMSDYTCAHCRATHRMLEELVTSRPGEVAVIVLPVPLDPALNPFIPPGATRPLPQDAMLTRLALAVWCAQPNEFGEMNRWLYAEDRVRTRTEAIAYAEQLVGKNSLQSALRDARIDSTIRLGCELFARCGSGVLPKMIAGSALISGPVADARVIDRALRSEAK